MLHGVNISLTLALAYQEIQNISTLVQHCTNVIQMFCVYLVHTPWNNFTFPNVWITLLCMCCTDVDNCAGEPCDVNGYCEELPGSFNCHCNPGYVGNGFSCQGQSSTSEIYKYLYYVKFYKLKIKLTYIILSKVSRYVH